MLLIVKAFYILFGIWYIRSNSKLKGKGTNIHTHLYRKIKKIYRNNTNHNGGKNNNNNKNNHIHLHIRFSEIMYIGSIKINSFEYGYGFMMITNF